LSARALQLWYGAWLGPRAALAAFAAPSQLADAELRARFDGDTAQLPHAWLDASPPLLARAALAHIAAHRRFGSPRFEPGSLRPIQIALVSLFEDARVERLALRDHPGLQALWAPYLGDNGGAAVVDLLARLAAALFDPRRRDGHPWVDKGQRLFFAQRERWRDPQLSRELGGLLGNDLGQMRLQFNWKGYVPAAPYRDDNHGLWRFEAGDQPPRELTALSAQRTGSEALQRPQPQPDTAAQRGDGQALAADGPAPAAAPLRLPEWDYRLRRSRPDWVAVRGEAIVPGDGTALTQWLQSQRDSVHTLRRQLGRERTHALVRLRRQRSGDALDLDAAIEAQIERRRGQLPDARLYRTLGRSRRPHALLLLLDASQSSAETLPGGGLTVIDTERRAAALLAEATAARGDRLAIDAFRSDGRRDVRLLSIKRFREHWNPAALARLGGLQPALSTRLGAALRASARQLDEADGPHWLIVISDGEPADVDVGDSRYLPEDARRAVQELRRRGVQCAALGLGECSALAHIFGRDRVQRIDHAEQLPLRLQRLYRRLRA
jgi:hypothetical protein